ncbi:MAG: hypothetical protein WD717_04365 [Nitrosarchaeum sp.]
MDEWNKYLNGNKNEFLEIAKEYAELVQREKEDHAELEAKYAPQIKQMKSIDRQLKRSQIIHEKD